MNNLVEYVLLFLPMIVCFSTSSICRIGKDSGKSVSFRPPSWVFGVMWSILTLLLGLSWVLCYRNDNKPLVHIIYSVLTICLALWIVIYGCVGNKIYALWTFIPLMAVCLMATVIGTVTSKLLICPLFGWLLFAMFLAVNDIKN